MKNIGLFGGTFDPIHIGHLIIAEFLRNELNLQEVWFIPAKIHPLKSNPSITKEKYRLEMLKIALSDNTYFCIEEVELRRKEVSFTTNTLDILLEKYAEIFPKFYFFIGMDNLNQLYRWKEPISILKKCQVVAFARPGFTPSKTTKRYIPYIKFVQMPLFDISSSMIRKRIKQGLSVKYLVPENIIEYIEKKQLYK
jgi:nicotinate-nucleotide adenylyltransferase